MRCYPVTQEDIDRICKKLDEEERKNKNNNMSKHKKEDSPALKEIDNDYPKHWLNKVPKRIKAIANVKSDLPVPVRDSDFEVAKGKVYDAWVNSYGAVAAIRESDNECLGMKPGEFEVVEWWIPKEVVILKSIKDDYKKLDKGDIVKTYDAFYNKDNELQFEQHVTNFGKVILTLMPDEYKVTKWEGIEYPKNSSPQVTVPTKRIPAEIRFTRDYFNRTHSFVKGDVLKYEFKYDEEGYLIFIEGDTLVHFQPCDYEVTQWKIEAVGGMGKNITIFPEELSGDKSTLYTDGRRWNATTQNILPLSEKENEFLTKTGEMFNLWCEISREEKLRHTHDKEVEDAIHKIQYVMMQRACIRQWPKKFTRS